MGELSLEKQFRRVRQGWVKGFHQTWKFMQAPSMSFLRMICMHTHSHSNIHAHTHLHMFTSTHTHHLAQNLPSEAVHLERSKIQVYIP